MSEAANSLDASFEKFAVGQPVSRLEDPMLLRGDGVYSDDISICLLYTSPSPRDLSTSRMPSSA